MQDAADWFARTRAPDFSEDDARRLRAWLEEDPRNLVAFREIFALWAGADRAELAEFFKEMGVTGSDP